MLNAFCYVLVIVLTLIGWILCLVEKAPHIYALSLAIMWLIIVRTSELKHK